MSEHKKSNKDHGDFVCDYCLKATAVVTVTKLNKSFYWCATCYTGYMSRVINRPRVRNA